MSYISFNGKPAPGSEPAKCFEYASDNLDFIPLAVNGSTRYMSVAREAEQYSINVWIQEKPRTAIIEVDDLQELTYENLGRAFAV